MHTQIKHTRTQLCNAIYNSREVNLYVFVCPLRFAMAHNLCLYAVLYINVLSKLMRHILVMNETILNMLDNTSDIVCIRYATRIGMNEQ